MEDTQIFAKRKQELQELQQSAHTPHVLADNMPTPEPYSESQNVEKETPKDADNPKGGENTHMKLIYPITAVAAVIIAGYFTFMITSQHAKQVENEARFQCASSSRYQVAKDGTTVWYAAEELYKKCLEEKGVK